MDAAIIPVELSSADALRSANGQLTDRLAESERLREELSKTVAAQLETMKRMKTRSAALVEALEPMELMATQEGWNTQLFPPAYGESVRKARGALAFAKEGQP